MGLENLTWKKIDAGIEIQICLPHLVMDASSESGAGGRGGGGGGVVYGIVVQVPCQGHHWARPAGP